MFYELDIYDNDLNRNINSDIIGQLRTLIQRVENVHISNFTD